MTHQPFHDLLKRAIGLDARTVGDTTIARAVEERARSCSIHDMERYFDKVANDREELQALVEAVVVPETWFFRDPEAFTAAANILRARWTGRKPLRILSLPCSTGEEPYTIAMAMLDAGFPPSAFSITAIEVSSLSLHRARLGVYGRNSFRGRDLAYRDRHFAQVAEGFRIADEVRAAVQFQQGNVFDLGDIESESFDIVFCRNLLIYFDTADQLRAVTGLMRLLSPDEAMFVGHSETRVMIQAGMASLQIPNAFGFRKAGAEGRAENASLTPSVTRRVPRKPDVSVLKGAPQPKPAKATTPIIRRRKAAEQGAIVNAPMPGLPDVRAAADRGDLKLAMDLGAELLKAGPACPETLHLLAVISDAAGDHAAAAEYYRKVLYLEPDHQDALTHFALLLDRKGDASGARRIRDRAQRIDARRAR